MKIGYLKTFKTIEEREDLIRRMTELGVNRIVLELESNRPQDGRKSLVDSIDSIGEGDTLIIKKLDDLGDSMLDIIDSLKRLESKGIDLQCLELPDTYNTIEDIEVKRLLQKQLLSVLVWVECKERRDIAEMQADAVRNLKKLKAQKGAGRPKKYTKDAVNTEDREIYYNVLTMLKHEIPISIISEELQISRNTVYSIKDDIEAEQPTDNV